MELTHDQPFARHVDIHAPSTTKSHHVVLTPYDFCTQAYHKNLQTVNESIDTDTDSDPDTCVCVDIYIYI